MTFWFPEAPLSPDESLQESPYPLLPLLAKNIQSREENKGAWSRTYKEAFSIPSAWRKIAPKAVVRVLSTLGLTNTHGIVSNPNLLGSATISHIVNKLP